MNRIEANGAQTVVWISGATSGIGEALAANVPFADARVISLSRRPHPTCESVTLELTDPSTWLAVGAHFAEVLAKFRGKRAIFIHNAYFHIDRAFVGEGDASAHEQEAIANVAGPLVLGDLFIRAARPAVEVGRDLGLVQMSSASARVAYEGLAIYGASKAAMEQWVRTVRMERARLGRGPWVVAVRPGFVDTPSARHSATYSPANYPNAPFAADALARGNALS
jgi:NAD(P)-dependent dehydrogenase (short-subunit alcohol dehydrogenase family)